MAGGKTCAHIITAQGIGSVAEELDRQRYHSSKGGLEPSLLPRLANSSPGTPIPASYRLNPNLSWVTCQQCEGEGQLISESLCLWE